MRDLLYLVHRIPYPPNKGDKLRSYHLLRQLGEHYRVHLGCFVDQAEDWKHTAKIAALCYDTCILARPRLPSLRALARGEPLSVAFFRHPAMQSWTESVVRRLHIDQALVYSSPMAQYVEHLPGMRRVVDFVDVDSEKWLNYADASRWPLSALYRHEARRLRRFELRIGAAFDGSTFVSKAEAQLFLRHGPDLNDKVSGVCNGVDADFFSPHIVFPNPYQADRPAICFTGAMDYRPNIDAVEWFAKQVLPDLRLRFPRLDFFIVGSRPSARVRDLAKQGGIVVTGTVADVRPYLAHAHLAVAPLRIARGVQNKVLEAMAMQKLIIASPQALEGIHAVAGSEVHSAASAADFITQVSAALHQSAPVCLAARARILSDYNWQHNLSRFHGLLEGRP